MNIFSGKLYLRYPVDILSKLIFGDVTFKWISLTNSSMYSVSISKDSVSGPLTRVYDTQYTVRDALLYDIICINLNQTLTTYWNLKVKFLIYNYVYMLVYFSFDRKPVHQTNILLTHCKGRILHGNKKNYAYYYCKQIRKHIVKILCTSCICILLVLPKLLRKKTQEVVYC